MPAPAIWRGLKVRYRGCCPPSPPHFRPPVPFRLIPGQEGLAANQIGNAGVDALTSHCSRLTALHLGAYNCIGREGVAQGLAGTVPSPLRRRHTRVPSALPRTPNPSAPPNPGVVTIGRCAGLTTLTIGGHNSIGRDGAEAIAAGCPALRTLTIGQSNRLGAAKWSVACSQCGIGA